MEKEYFMPSCFSNSLIFAFFLLRSKESVSLCLSIDSSKNHDFFHRSCCSLTDVLIQPTSKYNSANRFT